MRLSELTRLGRCLWTGPRTNHAEVNTTHPSNLVLLQSVTRMFNITPQVDLTDALRKALSTVADDLHQYVVSQLGEKMRVDPGSDTHQSQGPNSSSEPEVTTTPKRSSRVVATSSKKQFPDEFRKAQIALDATSQEEVCELKARHLEESLMGKRTLQPPTKKQRGGRSCEWSSRHCMTLSCAAKQMPGVQMAKTMLCALQAMR